MKPVNRGYNLASFDTPRLCEVSLELFHEGAVDLCVHGRHYILHLDANMADAQHHIATETLNAQETPFFKLMVKTQHTTASRIEVTRIFKQVETYQVAEEQGFKDLVSVREHLVNI